MALAQQLYEGPEGSAEGLITYMRTDGTFMSEEALGAVRAAIGARWAARWGCRGPCWCQWAQPGAALGC